MWPESALLTRLQGTHAIHLGTQSLSGEAVGCGKDRGNREEDGKREAGVGPGGGEGCRREKRKKESAGERGSTWSRESGPQRRGDKRRAAGQADDRPGLPGASPHLGWEESEGGSGILNQAGTCAALQGLAAPCWLNQDVVGRGMAARWATQHPLPAGASAVPSPACQEQGSPGSGSCAPRVVAVANGQIEPAPRSAPFLDPQFGS